MPQKANVQANPAVVKTGVAGERCQIHTRIIHGAGGVHGLLKAENSAVELGGDFDIVHDDVDMRDGLDISSGLNSVIVPPRKVVGWVDLRRLVALSVCQLR